MGLIFCSYNDGDQLTADDKMFIVDNVFSYHPDKAVKMGAGIDHIMVWLTNLSFKLFFIFF